MGCVQSSTKDSPDEFQKLNRNSAQAPPLGAPSSLNRLSAYIPTSGPLSGQSYWSRLDYSPTQTAETDGLRVRYAYVTQRGYYPEALDKANQDAVCVKKEFAGTPRQLFFGVFDGHGVHGTEAAQFAQSKMPVELAQDINLMDSPEAAFRAAMLKTNTQLHYSAVDDSMSGTTAITCLLKGRMAYVANVGDSRAVLAELRDDTLIAHALSHDQTPFRKDECERVRKAGARVLTLDQIEGLKDPEVECWKSEEEDSGDPPRLWAPNAMYPGTAFTRSIGDSLAEGIGVCAEPEVEVRRIGPSNPFLVIASDGVFEFLSNQTVVNMVSKYTDPQEAAIALVVESYYLWLQYETRTDDITAIVVMLETQETAAAPPTLQMRKSRSAAGLSNGKTLLQSMKRTFSGVGYSALSDQGSEPLSPQSFPSNPSMSDVLPSGRSSRFYSDEDRLPTPRRVLDRQKSRSRQEVAAIAAAGSPKMSMPPAVLQMSDSFSNGMPSQHTNGSNL